MQTSARRANVTARGRGVVRWLPWVAQLLRWAPWGHQVTHATPIPGLPANVPVQVRQDLYTDHLWHVVNNAGIWGRSGFRTAEAAERFARRVVIDRDGTEYRRNQPGVPPGVYHGEGSDPAGRRRTDEPDPRPSEELYQAMLFVARERFGPGVAERITRTVIRHNELSREIDAAYERGDHDAAEALEPQAEALREELEGLYHELEHGREDYHDLVAGVDEELAALYADYLANRLSLPRNATPEEKLAEVVSRARSIIDHHAWNAGLNGDRVNERITDDQVLEAMESAYRIRREHVERGRERQRTKRKSDLSAARKFARKAKRKRRRNPKGGGKWAITEHDQALASWGLAQLRDERLDVVLVPSQAGEGKIRVAVSANPEFYRRFLDRRRYGERKKQRSPGYRKRVTTALQRIVDDNPVRRGDWIGWELLELLRELEAEQLGGYEEV